MGVQVEQPAAPRIPGIYHSTRNGGRLLSTIRRSVAGRLVSGTEPRTLHTVAKNGNLLINVGLRADGTIPEVQLKPLRELGAFMQSYGEIIYGSRPIPGRHNLWCVVAGKSRRDFCVHPAWATARNSCRVRWSPANSAKRCANSGCLPANLSGH
ncbi:hypothetical protein GWP26_11530 [Corynebacterium macginleyi]|nr:hypothetical protein [Corynebacterium macginleyi]MBK4181448.1 hypothetical protein [Corynebacterium macginleyi]MBK4182983.1 hypothetical protein [Corynebacterium macginleyi]